MTKERHTQFRSLEGRRVSVALRDGSRIDDSHLISAGRNGAATIWLFSNNADTFVSLHEIIDLWEMGPKRSPVTKRVSSNSRTSTRRNTSPATT